MGPREREIERLEEELEHGDLTDRERSDIYAELREIERDVDDQERWRDEGHERGWL